MGKVGRPEEQGREKKKGNLYPSFPLTCFAAIMKGVAKGERDEHLL